VSDTARASLTVSPVKRVSVSFGDFYISLVLFLASVLEASDGRFSSRLSWIDRQSSQLFRLKCLIS
jgi:hypothetical protein